MSVRGRDPSHRHSPPSSRPDPVSVPLPDGPPRPRIALIGGGVHAVVVVDCIRRQGLAEVAGYCDAELHDERHMRRMEVPLLGDEAALARAVSHAELDGAILGMAGIDHSRLRRRLVEMLEGRAGHWFTAVHPDATVADTAELGPGTAVFARAVVNPLARVGRHAVVNTAAIVEHHAVVEDFAVVSPNATVCGCARVGYAAFLGAASVLITDVAVGAGSVVGAGAVVIRDVPDNVVVVGNPARILGRRENVRPEELARLAGLIRPEDGRAHAVQPAFVDGLECGAGV